MRNPILVRLAGWLLSQICRLWLRTLRVHVEDATPGHDPRKYGNQGRIYCFWHEDMLTLAPLFGGTGIYVLISRSHDGELISTAMESLGLHSIRGSTNRGGESAIKEIMTDLDGISIAITPDGPRGPRREFQPGAVFLASRTGRHLIPVGLAYERPWRLASWDRSVIPRPFSRVVLCSVGPLPVPNGVDKESLEKHRLKISVLLHESTERAEALLRRWRKGEQLPLVSPEAKAVEETPLSKAA